MVDANKAKLGEAQKQKVARTRSPAYPGINLEMAIKRADDLYSHDRLNAVPLSIAVKRWGFKEKSSGGLVTIAALKSFGLMRDSGGSGKDRKVQLTEEARRILLDKREESPEREEVIKRAALQPKIHLALWKKWGQDTPSDDLFTHELVYERSFNENSVKDFMKEYKDTIRFARLTDSDTLSAGEEDIQEDQEMPAVETTQPIKPGVQRPPAPPTIPGSKEISMPVGVSEEGQAIFAHVRFDAPLRKDYLKSLRGLLEALEKGLASEK